MTLAPGDAPVCVTGASGFVGSHVVQELLRRGHVVRGTVRDPGDDAKCAHLRAFEGAERLELTRADLFEEGGFDDAVAGCGAVVHTAAVAMLTADDPQKKIVDPSVNGVRNVLGSVRRDGGVRVFVQTSSMAAIVGCPEPGRTYSEDDWNEAATLKTDPYGLAKASAEREVWRFADEDGAPRCVAINPSLVLGPLYSKKHLRASPSVVRDLLTGTFPAVPKLHFGVVDGRDVGAAHANAVEQAVSGRFLLAAGTFWMREMAELLASRYPDRKIRTWELPNPVMYLASLFDKRIDRAMLDQLLGKRVALDSTRSREVLGLDYRSAEDSLSDTAESLIAGGYA